MSLYPTQNYTYNNSVKVEINLENLVMFHKYQLLKAYSYIKSLTADEHNELIEATNEIVEIFKSNIYDFTELTDNEIKWQWVGKIMAEQSIVLEKSIVIVNKLSL